MIAPLLEELSVEIGDKVLFGVHDIDSEPNTPTRFGVRGIPTLLLFKGGKVLDTKVGASSKQQIKDWILSKIQFNFKNSPTPYKLPVKMITALGSSLEHSLIASIIPEQAEDFIPNSFPIFAITFA